MAMHDDYIEFCPQCQSRYRLSEEMLGHRLKCKKCGHVFRSTIAASLPASSPSSARRSDSSPSDGKAVSSFVFSIVGLFAWLIPLIGLPVAVAGIVLGAKSLKSSNQHFATAGLALSCLAAILSVGNASLGIWIAGRLQGVADSQSPPNDSTTGSQDEILTKKTKDVWDQIRLIDLKVRSYSDAAQFWEQNYLLYGAINTDFIDTDLAALVKDWIGVSVEMHDLIVEYNQARAKISEGPQNAARVGAMAGSANPDNPQSGAAAGQLLFGMIGAAVADEQLKALHQQYEPKYESLKQRAKSLTERDKELGDILAKRYGLPFGRKL